MNRVMIFHHLKRALSITNYRYSIPEGREILEVREWRRSGPLGMDFPMVNPAFKFL